MITHGEDIIADVRNKLSPVKTILCLIKKII